MFSAKTFHKIYRFSAWYDLLVSWPFALPMTLGLLWSAVFTPLNNGLGLAPLPQLDVHAVLFGNFFGAVVIVWAAARLYLDDVRLAVFDGIGRLLFSFAMIWALWHGISPIVFGFLLPELALAVLQLLGKRSSQHQEPLA
ncbi:hypothetical protein [Epibacterium ulvae]|uniref:hypothetical protein n=1 Tax=Epibacterium ulvae TaxID=1156985 RepID=UPI0024931191|nr:hypothetical protein [Epibacterium ulvae]